MTIKNLEEKVSADKEDIVVTDVSMSNNVLTFTVEDLHEDSDSQNRIKTPITVNLPITPQSVNVVTNWSSTLSNNNIPSEKLVKDTIDSFETHTLTVRYSDDTTETITFLSPPSE